MKVYASKVFNYYIHYYIKEFQCAQMFCDKNRIIILAQKDYYL